MTFLMLAVRQLADVFRKKELSNSFPFLFNFAEFGGDICAVIDSWCDRKYSNGKACYFIQAISRLALIFAQQVSMPMAFHAYI